MNKKELTWLFCLIALAIGATDAFSAGEARMKLSDTMMKKHPACSLLLSPEKSRTLSMGTFSFLRALCSGQNNLSRSPKPLLQHGEHNISRITKNSGLREKMRSSKKFEDIKGSSIDAFLLSNVNDPNADFGNRSSQNSPVVVADITHNALIYAFRDTGDFRNQPGGSMIGWAVSIDHGNTWTDKGSVPALSDTQWLYGDPSLACSSNGRCYLAGVDCNISGCMSDKIEIAITTDGGQSWSNKVNAVPPMGQWEKPVLAVDNTGGTCNGDVYMVANDALHGTMEFLRSADGGLTWSTQPMQLNSGHEACGDNSAAIAIAPNGTIYVAWEHFGGCSGALEPRIELVRSSDCGDTWSIMNTVAVITPVGDTFTSNQCFVPALKGFIGAKSYPVIAVNPADSSMVYAIFASDPDGNNSSGDNGDIYFTKSADSGDTWLTTPLKINDDAGLNDQFFPMLTVSSSETLFAGWNDRRNDPDNLKMDIYGAFSVDNGDHWSSNFKIAPSEFSPAVNYDPELYYCDMGDLNTAAVDPGNSNWVAAFGANYRQIDSRADQDVFLSRLAFNSPILEIDSWLISDSGTNGNGNGIPEPGEIIKLSITLANKSAVTTAHNVSANLSIFESDFDKAAVTQNYSAFPDIVPGGTGSNEADYLIYIYPSTACGSDIRIILDTSSAEGSFTDMIILHLGQTSTVTLLSENFNTCPPIPSGWMTLGNAWSCADTCSRALFRDHYPIADSDCMGPGAMDGQLISPPMDASTFSELFLTFDHDFYPYSGNEIADVDVKANGGNWINVARYKANAIGNAKIDLTAQAGGASNVQVRFHYYNANYDYYWGIDNIWIGRWANACAAPVGPVLAYQSNSIDDSRGNNDGHADPGEQNIHMKVIVRNNGSVSAINISGTLTSASGDVIITQAVSSYPNISSNGTAQNDYDFIFDVSSTASCGKNLLFQLSMDTSQGKFIVPFEVLVGIATVLMTADFDHGLPPGWSIIGNANGKTWNWIDSCLRTEFPSPYMIVDSSCAGSTAMNEQLITNIIDAANAASFILTFDHAYYQKGAEKADVDVKIDEGSWINAAEYTTDAYGPVSLDLTNPAAGSSNVQIRFHYYNGANAYWWALDNVTASTAPVCKQIAAHLLSNKPVVDDTGSPTHNGIFEPGESAILRSNLENTGTATATSVSGTLITSDTTITITDASASYPDIAPGANQTCTNCYGVTAGTIRPGLHWDFIVTESTSCIDCNAGLQNHTFHVGASFTDVPPSQMFYSYIETILHNGITSGCTAMQYCPASDVQRQQMAKFICNSMNARSPSSCPTSACAGIFTDVPTSNPFCAYIEALYNLSIISGCQLSPLKYCPFDMVRRDGMAKFICLSMNIVAPDSCTIASCTGIFTDVPNTNPFCAYIEGIYNAGVVAGCLASPLMYCPGNNVSRAQMAKYLVNGFGFTL